MRKALTAFIAASAVAFTVVYSPLATPISAASCDDFKVIFARGSGQKLSDRDAHTFRTELENALKSRSPGLRYSFYELGSAPHSNSRYPAVAIDFFDAISSKISANNASSYNNSVRQGITELESYISEVTSVCKDTKFILAGYSQGAQVISLSIPNLSPSQILYAATFGDPKLYLPEGKGILPDACLGKNLSPYREYAPNCRTYAGLLDAKNPYQTSNWLDKIGLWCKDGDLICGAGLKFGSTSEGDNLLARIINSALAAHTSYADDGIYKLASQTIVDKIRSAHPIQITKTGLNNNRDTVFLFDKTESMWAFFSKYKKEADRLAKSLAKDGGRISLYTYGDLAEEKPQRLTDLGDDIAKFSTALYGINLGGGGDDPESLLSALLTVMDTQNWQAGATKSIIVFTEASYHNPDLDGTTLAQVLKRSLEIDPVNIYITSPRAEHSADYLAITEATSGLYFSDYANLNLDPIANRPNINFPLNEYSGVPGQTFEFNVFSDTLADSYEWDLDFDGIFETTTTAESITKSYPSATSGYIQVRIHTPTGLSSASARVNVLAQTPTPITIDNLSANIQANSDSHFSAEISFASSSPTTLVSLDSASLGITTLNHFTITDLTETSTLTLTPITTDGFLGEPTSIQLNIPNSGRGSTANTSTDTLSSSSTTSVNHNITTQTIIIPLAPNSGKH